MGKHLVATEAVFHEGDGQAVTDYWTAVEDIVEWAGKQYLVVQLPLPLDASTVDSQPT